MKIYKEKLLIAVLLLAGCRGGGEKTNAAIAPEDEAIPVRITAVEQRVLERTLSFSGTMEPWKEAYLGAQMGGRIEKLYVDKGDRVKAGDLLVQMGDEQRVQAEAQLVAVKKDWERLKELLEKGSIPQQSFDQIDARYKAAQAAYDLVLESTRLRAPFAGVIAERLMNEGEVFVLFPSGRGAPAILRLMQVDRLKVRVHVAEPDLPSVRVEQEARIRTDAYPERVFAGRLVHLDPFVDAATRTAAAEIEVPNDDGVLKPGMYAQVELRLGQAEVLLVPREALLHQSGTGIYYLFAVQEGRAYRREVVRGSDAGEWIEIRQGVDAGDSVVVAGQSRLVDGVLVQVAKEGGKR